MSTRRKFETKSAKSRENMLRMKMPYFDVKFVDGEGEGRTIEGYASVFGKIDHGNDVVLPGAFKKTITERGNSIKLLWQHDAREVIGKITELREDSKGLFMRAVISETTRGLDAIKLLKDEAIEGLSIGFDVIPGGSEIVRKDGKALRHIKEVRLWEVSLVTFPANEAASVVELKNEDVVAEDKSNEVKVLGLDDDLAAVAIADRFAASMRGGIQNELNALQKSGWINEADRRASEKALNDAIDTLLASLPDGVGDTLIPVWYSTGEQVAEEIKTDYNDSQSSDKLEPVKGEADITSAEAEETKDEAGPSVQTPTSAVVQAEMLLAEIGQIELEIARMKA